MPYLEKDIQDRAVVLLLKIKNVGSFQGQEKMAAKISRHDLQFLTF